MNTIITPPLPDISRTRSKRGAVVITDVKGYHQMDLYSCGAAVVATLSNPLRPRAFGGKGAEGMKKEIPSS